jgi:Spy/CpxP family protein refolding chaperone
MNPDTRQKAGLWLAVVFALGLAIGAVFGYNFAHKSFAAGRPPAPTSLSEPERRAARVADMTRELQLTPEQSQKVDTVLHQAHDEMRTIREKSDADMDAVKQKARSEMRTFLTPEQLPKYEAFVKKLDEERKKQQAQSPR